jgi:class 3 adenylate cyclase
MGTAADGFFATFEGPARAIRCACAIREGVHDLGLRIRAGLHTGEAEIAHDDVTGIACTLPLEFRRQQALTRCSSLKR